MLLMVIVSLGGAIVSKSSDETNYDEKMRSISKGIRKVYPQSEYRKILEQIIPHFPATPAELAFVKLWDHDLAEMINTRMVKLKREING
jgi:hypothetical protein